MMAGQEFEERTVADLLRESTAFKQCPNCDKTVVRLGPHRCPSSQPRSPSREDRTQRAARDTRDGDTLVGLFQRAAGGAYAYHDLDESRRPRCMYVDRSKANKVAVVPLIEAKERGKSPCGACRRLRERDAEE